MKISGIKTKAITVNSAAVKNYLKLFKKSQFTRETNRPQQMTPTLILPLIEKNWIFL
jgi:hypothetical protein